MHVDITREVARFRAWAEDGAPDTLGLGHGVEWESNYPYWEELYAAVQRVIDRPESLNRELIEHVLFVLARDNEDETVAAMLAKSEGATRRILPAALSHPDSDARWQIASILPQALGVEATTPLAQLMTDPDEYVRRRATAAMEQLGG